MKSFLNHICHNLTKRLPFSHLKKNTPTRKTIKAEKLQEICNLISPSFDYCTNIIHLIHDDYNMLHERNKVITAFLHNTWNIELPSHHHLRENFDKSDIQMAEEKIIELKLSENIELHLVRQSSANNVNIQKIEIKNLNIEGDLKIELNHICEIELTNNVFQKSAVIRVIGTKQCRKCVFRNNQFWGSFFHSTFNVASIDFTANEFLNHIDLNFMPPIIEMPSHNGGIVDNEEEYHRELNAITHKFILTESYLKFTKNKAIALFLRDCKNLAASYRSDIIPFRKIEFLGGNVINYLSIDTHHSAVNCSSGIRADANRIFFDVSDEIGISIKASDKTYSINGLDSQTREYQLSYLEFFSRLKEGAAKQHIPVREDIYAKKIRHFSRVLMSQWEDKIIFHWGNLISKGGTAWFRPLWLLVTSQTLLATIAYCLFAGYDLQMGKECVPHWDMPCNPYLERGWGSFGALVAWFMNPASLLPSTEITMASWPIYVLFLFHKIFAAVFYYEIVKTLRRFTK